MSIFDDALGRGPEGATYRPPVVRKRTPGDRAKAYAWYRWGFGHRPLPRFELPDAASPRGSEPEPSTGP